MYRILCVVLVVALLGCSDDVTENTSNNVNNVNNSNNVNNVNNSNNANNINNVNNVADMGADTGSTPDMSTADAGDEVDMMTAVEIAEVEPNDGSTTDEVQQVQANSIITGAIGSPGDADVYSFDATPGEVYEMVIEIPPDSQLSPHMAVFDNGRDGDPAGQDYVKIGTAVPEVEILAMGGGYLVAVRDRRNVEGGSVGSPDHTYVLSILPRNREDYVRGAVTFGDPLSGTLSSPGAIALYTFMATEGQDVNFDMSASGDVDGRLYVYAESEGDWIARQDDRSLGDPNPLLSAPLFASGNMILVVENIAEDASQLGYSIETSSP